MRPRLTMFARGVLFVCVLLLFSLPLQSGTRPLPEDRAVHLYQLLARLNTTARFMQVVAHPDEKMVAC